MIKNATLYITILAEISYYWCYWLVDNNGQYKILGGAKHPKRKEKKSLGEERSCPTNELKMKTNKQGSFFSGLDNSRKNET